MFRRAPCRRLNAGAGVLCAGLVLVACAPTAESDTAAPCTCEVEVTETDPTNGDESFYHRHPVTFSLSEPCPCGTPEVTLEGPGGDVEGETTLSEDGTTVVFSPAEPLEPRADHGATLAYCGGERALSFRTSELGDELESGVELDGGTWWVDLDEIDVVEPDLPGS